MTSTATPSIVLPPGPRLPRPAQWIRAVTKRRQTLQSLHRTYGSAFTMDLPRLGRAVVLSDPGEVRQFFRSNPAELDNATRNLGRLLGPNSLFALREERHQRQRKLLVPPFHGKRLDGYATEMERIALAEFATWRADTEFPTLPAMSRITLNIMLKVLFGAEGREFDELRVLLPKMVKAGSLLNLAPIPEWELGGYAPWGRFRALRRRYDEIADTLLARAAADPELDERTDVLSLMLRARYDDGSALHRDEIADQLFTLLTAGHETTATTLAWAIERLRRHPDVVRRLVEDVDAGETELLNATIVETLRSRPVIDFTLRQVHAERLTIGRWTLPRGQVVLAAIALLHDDPEMYADPEVFRPDRFLGTKPDTYAWIPFGGGIRRCIGAAFAQLEMKVVLRTLLREFELLPTTEPDEPWHARGVSYAPGNGGLAMVRPRAA